MKSIDPYLIFNGNCRQAMEFYKKCLGGELYIMPFSEMPGGLGDFPKEAKDKIMHAALSFGHELLMASDNHPAMPFQAGNNFSISTRYPRLYRTWDLL